MEAEDISDSADPLQALAIVADNLGLDADDIKLFRLISKRTKEVADSQIKSLKVDLSVDLQALEASGLLPRLGTFDLKLRDPQIDDEQADKSHIPELRIKFAQVVARQCSPTLRSLRIAGKRWSPEEKLGIATALGSVRWEKLKKIDVNDFDNFFSIFLSTSGSGFTNIMPNLRSIDCTHSCSSDDIDILCEHPEILENLVTLSVWNDGDALAPKLWNMLAIPVNLFEMDVTPCFGEHLDLLASTYFEGLQSLSFTAHGDLLLKEILTRPWPRLRSITINSARIPGEDMSALALAGREIFPELKSLIMRLVECDWSLFLETSLPIEELCIYSCIRSSDDVDLVKVALCSLPNVKVFCFSPGSEFVSGLLFDDFGPLFNGPHMNKLESITIHDIQNSWASYTLDSMFSDNQLLPNLRSLDLCFGSNRLAMVSLIGHGSLGGMPNLKNLTLKEPLNQEEGTEGLDTEEVDMDVARRALLRVWPDLDIRFS